MKFVQLTDVSGSTVYINPAQVTLFYQVENRGTTIVFVGQGSTTTVKEDLNTVLRELRDAR